MYAYSLLAEADGGSSSGGMIQLLILLAIPFGMYFLLIRPQRKRQKDQQNLQSSLGIGDEVITTSGVYGFITGEEPDRFWLEIDDDVQIRIAKAAIQGKVIADSDDGDGDGSEEDDADDEPDELPADDTADDTDDES